MLSLSCFASDYGVYIGAEKECVLSLLCNSERVKTAVLELSDFSKDDVALLHENQIEIFAYLNVGAIENFRTYYKDFAHLTLSPYENWSEEFWIDVRKNEWQDFLVNTLAAAIAEKSADGFFLDNFDIYSLYKSDDVFQALLAILRGLRNYGVKIIINGGDEAVSAILESGKANLIDGVNQESVFSRIKSYKLQLFAKQKKDDTKYFVDYLDNVKRAGLEVFVIEYAKSKTLRSYCENECEKRKYRYFVSTDLELDGGKK